MCVVVTPLWQAMTAAVPKVEYLNLGEKQVAKVDRPTRFVKLRVTRMMTRMTRGQVASFTK